MSDAYIYIEVTSGPNSGLSKALLYLRECNPRHFPDQIPGWWHKPPDDARALVARSLSCHGLTGRLSVVLYVHDLHKDLKTLPPRWTGFTARGSPAIARSPGRTEEE